MMEPDEPQATGRSHQPASRIVVGGLGVNIPPAPTSAVAAPGVPAGGQPLEVLRFREEYAALWGTSVQALTSAARLTYPPQGGRLDFPGFLASVLAAVAANLGGTDAVIAGRPGSWEADLVDQLVCGTVGYEESDLDGYRTEPVVIHLNVHRLLVEDASTRPGEIETPYERELDEVYRRHSDLSDEEYDSQAEDADVDAVEARWAGRYAEYADAFTAAVAAEAARIEGLQVPVTVVANTETDGGADQGPEHPDQFAEVSTLIWRLWNAARSSVPLPAQPTTPPSS